MTSDLILTADFVTQVVAGRFELKQRIRFGYKSFGSRHIRYWLSVELIYIILSILIRFSPFVWRPSEMMHRTSSRRGHGSRLALRSIWLPIIGWVSVSVQRTPESKWLSFWLPWRVVEIHAFEQRSTRVEKEHERGSSKCRGGNNVPPSAGNAKVFNEPAGQTRR